MDSDTVTEYIISERQVKKGFTDLKKVKDSFTLFFMPDPSAGSSVPLLLAPGLRSSEGFRFVLNEPGFTAITSNSESDSDFGSDSGSHSGPHSDSHSDVSGICFKKIVAIG